MILNPSHDITLKGLPSEILDAYVRYKKGSRAIVAWLVQFGPRKYKGRKTLPIKELANLALSLTNRIYELPEVIHFHFKETIAARKRLSQYFRKSIDLADDDPDTINHEHFTTSLTKIYTDLCEQCQTCCKQKQSKSQELCSVDIAEPIRNHYACLPVEDSPDHQINDAAIVGCDECLHEQTYQCPGLQADVGIENDELSLAIETASILERMQEIISAVESIWIEAGHGSSHFISASGATNVAWAMMQDLETQLRNENEILDLGVLHKRCCLFKDTGESPNNAFSTAHALLKSLSESDRAITHYSNCHKLTVIAHCPSCVQKPIDYVQQSDTDETEKKSTTSFPLALIDNILHLICGTRPGTVILQSSPVFAEIRYLLTHRGDKSTTLRCVLGIYLLTTAYRTHLSALSKPTTISTCRITALKLSKQAVTAIDTVLNDKDSFPCHCPQTLAFHLANLRDDMDVYSKHKCWDLYHQSPWVAGNHIIYTLDALAYYGMRLFHYRHYIGAMLHSYNILVELGGLARIPILEYLCDTFRDIFFPSGRPKSSFKNSWARYIGARLKFKKGRRSHGAGGSEGGDSWCMAVPAHAARDAAGFGIDVKQDRAELEAKFDYGRFDPLIRAKQMNWRVDLDAFGGRDEVEKSVSGRRASSATSTMARLSVSEKPPSSSSSGSRATSISEASSSSTTQTAISPDTLSTDPFALCTDPPIPTQTQPQFQPTPHLLQTLHQTLNSHSQPTTPNPSPSTPLAPPTLTLSHIHLFTKCTRLIQAITSKVHTSSPSSAKEKESKTCICFVHTLVSGADRIVEGRRFGGVESWSREERAVLDVLGEGIGSEFGGEGAWAIGWEV